MIKALGMRCVWGLCGALAGVLLLAPATRAEVTSDLSGSVLVFPKVEWNGDRDTVIDITNTSNNLVHAQCFYVNGANFGFGPLWQVTDFSIWLTKQQPTQWAVSQGRPVTPFDPPGSPGSGIDPGAIPPVPRGFTGELKCVQVDPSGVPFGGNNLKGEAVLREMVNGDVSKYNAIAILANPDLASLEPTHELLLDNSPDNDGEYNSCPNMLLMDHFTDGAPDLAVEQFNSDWCADTPGGNLCPIRPFLTIIPCSQDFENLIPGTVTFQFLIFNEFESIISTSTTVTCWRQTRLCDIVAPTGRCTLDPDGPPCTGDGECIDADLGFCEKSCPFAYGVLGTLTAQSVISPVGLDGGILAIGEEKHWQAMENGGQQTAFSWAAWNLQQLDNRYDETGGQVVDRIQLPERF